MNVDNSVRNRRRLQLILVIAVFAVPAILATVLGALGWQPGTRSHGEPVTPQRSVESVKIPLTKGGQWAWRDSEPRLTLVALPGPDCARQCLATLTLMRNARITLNKNMDRLRLLYVGAPPRGVPDDRIMREWVIGSDPDGALQSFRAKQRDSVAALLVESNGTALVRYPAGFDPNGLRKDLQKVIR